MKKRFLPREHKKRKKLKDRWRKPKGFHSKARRKERHAPRMPGFGYRTPKTERKETKVVHNLDELRQSSGMVQIASRVGLKKRLKMLELAEKMKIKVLNVKLERVRQKVEKKLKVEEKKPKKKKKPEPKKKGLEKKAAPKKPAKQISKKAAPKKPAPEKTTVRKAGRGR